MEDRDFLNGDSGSAGCGSSTTSHPDVAMAVPHRGHISTRAPGLVGWGHRIDVPIETPGLVRSPVVYERRTKTKAILWSQTAGRDMHGMIGEKHLGAIGQLPEAEA